MILSYEEYSTTYTSYAEAHTWKWVYYCRAWKEMRGVAAPFTVAAIRAGCKCEVIPKADNEEEVERFDYSKCPIHTEEDDEAIMEFISEPPDDRDAA